jgi:predicted transcriptional regulator YdeE
MEGPDSYIQVPAHRLATTTYTGPAPGLARVRDILRAWAMTHGADTDDRPFEEYLSGIGAITADDAQFKVYWPLKKK